MQMRALGRSGIEIAPLMFGGNVFGWTTDEAMSHALLDAFVDHGFNAVDTADVYSAWAPGHVGGESETVLGTWLAGRGRRAKVVVATKLGMLAPNNGLKRSQIEAAVDASLRRLRTDYIDLYQAHRDDETTRPEETLEAFDALLKAGKIRAIGASNYTPERLKTALDVSAAKGFARFESLQPEYNLASRVKFEGAVQDLCIAEDVGVITYSSLASGFLTGKYRVPADVSKSPRGKAAAERFLNPRGQAILGALDAVAQARGAEPAEIALAWLIAQPGVTAAIASASAPDQLAALMKGAVLQLAPGELDALTASSV
jgi:aryl-alcohol dehydrogenase-like predicted oxidoreductase